MEENSKEKEVDTAPLHIRDIRKSALDVLSVKAKSAGYEDRMHYVRDLLEKAASVPELYAYRVVGQVGKGGIRRYSSHINGTSTTYSNFSQDEADAMQRAENFIRRNQVGDREKAYKILVEQFGEDNVFEVPV